MKTKILTQFKRKPALFVHERYSLPNSYDGCPQNYENCIINNIYLYCCKNDIGHVAISLSPFSDCKCSNYQLWMGVCSITEKILQSKLKLCVCYNHKILARFKTRLKLTFQVMFALAKSFPSTCIYSKIYTIKGMLSVEIERFTPCTYHYFE